MIAREQDLRDLVGEITRRDVAALDIDDDLVERLGIDSLMALRVLAAVEKRFVVRIPDERLVELRTLRQLAELVAIADESPEGD